ncbi:MAG: site-specific DNA-methyltransferase, partial [Deltaproteobacteria bacterium]|nr:site-specific DNA-methyltransferase [Deltaproteobacteria bacterium]
MSAGNIHKSDPIHTKCKVYFDDSKNMSAVPSNSADLIVTSPPYPMIAMWDEIFSQQNPSIKNALEKQDGPLAFELMHQELDRVWQEGYRVLKDGSLACVNIGDAARTINGDFRLYPNHARILNALVNLGFSVLPAIIWRKQTNAPNKFMGSGMLPAGAYVTLEHEYILILRKGSKREFKKDKDKQNRRRSSIFWEERNIWFSDVWMDLQGTVQKMNNKKTRLRSGAYPFELAYRLINMFSVKGDLVLDPFLGTGTTMAAAMASCRNSIGFEIDSNFKDAIQLITHDIVEFSNRYN